jgi:hypothetical protein
MKRQSSPQTPNFPQTSEKLFAMAKDGGGHFFYSDIRKELETLIASGYEQQAKDIAIKIMKVYTYRPALKWELKRLLTDDEIAEFEKWHKTAKSSKPKAQCSSCGSEKIARILYGMPMYNEKLKKQLDRGTVMLGGCCVTGNDPKYECMNCGMLFYKRPTGKDPNWTGKIIVRSENNKQNILIKA